METVCGIQNVAVASQRSAGSAFQGCAPTQTIKRHWRFTTLISVLRCDKEVSDILNDQKQQQRGLKIPEVTTED
ncbi:hypothetical protein DOTSEDRAFT_46158 [Dothistroma septosporum NZE10]|uniref:Uncharacterized protein n=1 Tax=Dothistroma septosporum (strain NZE10 / CBS 128990) TaxID=675120 RepID=N1PKS9_DOTSN|nr:hypothetical protein DOTSEDRAFT_46158 [Dothistroma septosporum NZE10]